MSISKEPGREKVNAPTPWEWDGNGTGSNLGIYIGGASRRVGKKN